VYCGGELAEESYQRGVVYTLRIKEATTSFFEKEAYLYLTEAMEWIQIDADLN